MPDVPGQKPPKKRRWPFLLLALLVLAGAGTGTYAVLREMTAPADPECTIAGKDGEVTQRLEPEQAANAATIGAVGTARGLSLRAITIAIATAMQESSLYNLDHGHSDSLGLFQQRPSQGWGTAEEIMDPVYAAGQFYDQLVEVPGYETMSLTDAAQAVQRSAHPDAYAKHESSASAWGKALTGRSPGALSCVTDGERVRGDTQEIAEKLAYEFGDRVETNGAAGIRVTAALDRQAADGTSRRGWALAHWAVTNAADLGIERITYGNRVWEASDSGDGWQVTDEQSDGKNTAGATAEVRLTVFSRE